MGLFDVFTGKSNDAIVFCDVLSKMNKLLIQFSNTWNSNGKIDRKLYQEIDSCYQALIQSIELMPPGRVESMMEKPITRYTDGLVQVAFIGKSNYSLGETWMRSQQDYFKLKMLIERHS